MELVKAEILWTRRCNLICGYCGMFYGKTDPRPPFIKKDWNLWKQGLQNLYDMGCRFTAVYGAEPMMDMEYLPDYFKECQRLGMMHTLITNCTVPKTKEKLKLLVDNGLHSLTVSFDGDDNELVDKSSAIKSSKGLNTVRWFKKEFGNHVRDSAVVFTLTKTNLFSILKWIPKLAAEDIYVFFDLIHHDIGNKNTKCKNYGGIDNLIFHDQDMNLLKDFGRQLKTLKKDINIGSYVHQSNSFIDVLINTPELYVQKQWHCARPEYKDIFPSWLTIDYDGTTRICDDFHWDTDVQYKFWDLNNKQTIDAFKEYAYNQAHDNCISCFWNTHFDAHMIKIGNETFSNYVNNSFNDGKQTYK